MGLYRNNLVSDLPYNNDIFINAYKDEKLVWNQNWLYETAGTFSLFLKAGFYHIKMKGGGGAGGAGAGGAGGTAPLYERTINLTEDQTVEISVGEGGKIYGTTGSNGGAPGSNRSTGNVQYGGGGGGYPSYVKCVLGNSDYYVVANGGGGGGGGGANAAGGRYQGGSGGCGGGGYYYMNNKGELKDYHGATGGAGSAVEAPGGAGSNGPGQTFSGYTASAGNGGSGYRRGGGAGGQGFGASGGGGGGGKSNDGDGYRRRAGGGGGGAPGCPDAGGGAGGLSINDSYSGQGSNYHTTPTSSTNYLGETSTLGQGGGVNTNGHNGWVYIERVSNNIEYDDSDIPVSIPKPTDLNDLTLIDSVTGNSNKTGTITKKGWYLVKVRAATGDGQGSTANGGSTGGCISDAIVYLFENSEYLMWGASRMYTGYPVPSGNASFQNFTAKVESGKLGGAGAHGVSWNESGGGGGSAGGCGSNIHTDGGSGGGGAGFIAGINGKDLSSTESWTVGNFSVDSVLAMVLAGGGGGNVGDNGEPRTGGAGGGAWGNGGDGYNVSGGSGPGGNTFGKGGSTGTSSWAGSAAGAWCLRDFTSNTFESGVGIKTGSNLTIGTVELYYINNQITI